MLNIVVIENGQSGTVLEQCLIDAGYQCLKIRDSGQFLELTGKVTPDAIIFRVDSPTKTLLDDLHALNRSQPLPVILFAEECPEDYYAQVIHAEVSAFVVDGFACKRLPSIIQVAVARFKQQQALRVALEEARTQLEDRKQIDRAKAILIRARDFTENEAYHTLRKLAMDRNITLGEMARNVIAMADLLK